jgi:hypothetical protein
MSKPRLVERTQLLIISEKTQFLIQGRELRPLCIHNHET